MNRHDTLLLSGGTAQNRKFLRSILQEDFNLLEAATTQQTLTLLRQNLACIAGVLLDVSESEGFDRNLLEAQADLLNETGVIVLCENEDIGILSQAFGNGAADVITLNYDSNALRRRIRNIVDLWLHKRNLEDLVRQQSEALRHSNDTMVETLSSLIEYRSAETGQHILRIRHFTRSLLEEVAQGCPEYGLTEEQIRLISSASVLHDVGKIAIPDDILKKNGPLTRAEHEIMKTHTLTGCEILSRIGDMGNREYLRYAYNICRYHHERWDGQGYPQGLSGEDIPICAQVVGLADAYEALTSKREYKDAIAPEIAVNMILMGQCGAFSPKLLECFKRVADRYAALTKVYADGKTEECEGFDTILPSPVAHKTGESVEMIRSKYLVLVHYLNGLLIELDMDRGFFYLVYNPYPEITRFQQINTLDDIRRLLYRIVEPEDREKMRAFLDREIDMFLDRGLRRATFYFRFRGQNGSERFEMTLLRLDPSSPRRTLAVLCRRVDEIQATGNQLLLADSTYVCRNDSTFTLERLNGNTQTLAGYTPKALERRFGGRLVELIHPEDREMVRRQFSQQLARGSMVELEHRVCHQNGSVLWVLNKSRLVVENGQERIHSFLTDITQTRKNLDRINEKCRQYEIILAQTENVLFEWDVEKDTISFSDTWERIFDVPPISEKVMKEIRSGSIFHPDDLPWLLDAIRNLESGSRYEMVEMRIVHTGGRYQWCRFRASALRDQSGRLEKIVGIIINIDVEKMAERELQDRAERDALTKLLNKSSGRKHAEAYLGQYPQGVPCAMLIVDLDKFKEVNDQYGHLFGDAVLARVARELKGLFHSQDILARIGGDEFMVLMRGVMDRTVVENRCRQLLRVLENAFQEEGRKLPLSCSIGIAMGPGDGRSYNDLFIRADKALYQAKERGRNGYIFYSGDDAFPILQPRQTKEIDSDQRPGLADNNIVQYVFQKIYASQDVETSIQEALRLIGEQMNVSRVYIFENSQDNLRCSNTYEWCNKGITPEIQNLQDIRYEELKGFLDMYDENGILYCPDVSTLSPSVREVVESQGIKSMLHCAIREQGVFRGYIGFDECTNHRLWTKEQIRILTYFSEMLSVFLLKNRAQERISQRAEELSTILDNQNAWIYIIDPESCELKYLNAKTRSLAPKAQEGMRCHQALMGLPQRCPGCPAWEILHKTTASAPMRNGKFNLEVVAEATRISWGGESACLLTCREKDLKL